MIWLPISSAPKDGTCILIARRLKDDSGKLSDPEVIIGKWGCPWGVGPGEWLGVNVANLRGEASVSSITVHSEYPYYADVGPIAWQPLPSPPDLTITTPHVFEGAG